MAEKFPGALNVAVFGQTETSPITCVLRGEDSLRKLGSVGRPIPAIHRGGLHRRLFRRSGGR
jgi:fatty-acyl-CoA synthase